MGQLIMGIPKVPAAKMSANVPPPPFPFSFISHSISAVSATARITAGGIVTSIPKQLNDKTPAQNIPTIFPLNVSKV